jgi:hypothetical protein
MLSDDGAADFCWPLDRHEQDGFWLRQRADRMRAATWWIGRRRQGRLRDELLNRELFLSLAEARVVLDE